MACQRSSTPCSRPLKQIFWCICEPHTNGYCVSTNGCRHSARMFMHPCGEGKRLRCHHAGRNVASRRLVHAQLADAWNRPDTAAGAGRRNHLLARRDTHSKIVRSIISTVVRAAGRWIPHVLAVHRCMKFTGIGLNECSSPGPGDYAGSVRHAGMLAQR
jgi:hypothetical protein